MVHYTDSDMEPLLPDQPVKKKKRRVQDVFREVVDQLRFKSKGYRKIGKGEGGGGSGDGMHDYYVRQAGSGIGGFSGHRYQKGDGFFGRMVSGAILPLIKKVLPYLGGQALEAGVGIANDVFSGQKFGESARKRLKTTAANMEEKALEKVRSITGSGRRRRRKTRKVTVPKTSRKRKASKRKTKAPSRQKKKVAKKPKGKRRRRISKKQVPFNFL